MNVEINLNSSLVYIENCLEFEADPTIMAEKDTNPLVMSVLIKEKLPYNSAR